MNNKTITRRLEFICVIDEMFFSNIAAVILIDVCITIQHCMACYWLVWQCLVYVYYAAGTVKGK